MLSGLGARTHDHLVDVDVLRKLRDVDDGVRVVAPNIGFYGEQHAPMSYDLADDSEAIDPQRLADAIISAIDDAARTGRLAPARIEDRELERNAGAAAHTRLYREALRDPVPPRQPRGMGTIPLDGAARTTRRTP